MKFTERDVLALYASIYKYRPVDIVTFLSDRRYLGNDTGGGKDIYPGWWPYLKAIFADDHRYLIIFTGATGIGKSKIAAYCVAYVIYRLCCMHNPWVFFEKGQSGIFGVSFFNMVEMDGGSKAYRYLQAALTSSPWFTSFAHASAGLSGTVSIPGFSWVHSTPRKKGFGIQGEDIVTGILDEVDDPLASKGDQNRVLAAWNATFLRFSGRFLHKGTQSSVSRLFVVSSKQDDMGFIENFVKQQEGKPNTLIVDAKQWEILKPGDYKMGKFYVFVGDDFEPSRIVYDKKEAGELISAGRRIEEIPLEYLDRFELDVVMALRDYAGIAVRGMRKNKLFGNERYIKFDVSKQNPVLMETIDTDLDDERKWIDFVDLSKLRVSKDIPRACHYDISYAHDCAAIALSCCAGWQTGEYENEDGTFSSIRVPIVETDLIFRVRAKKGGKIRLSKMRELIIALRRKGIKFSVVSADLRLLSEDTRQILQKAHINSEYFSCDKTPQCAVDLRTIMSEDRWLCHPHRWFYFEAKHIEHDLVSNKIDHPDTVKERWIGADGAMKEKVIEGSKDVFDAVCGSVHHVLRLAKDIPSARQMKSLLSNLQSPIRQSGLSSMAPSWLSGSRAIDVNEAQLPEAKNENMKKMTSLLKTLRKR